MKRVLAPMARGLAWWKDSVHLLEASFMDFYNHHVSIFNWNSNFFLFQWVISFLILFISNVFFYISIIYTLTLSPSSSSSSSANKSSSSTGTNNGFPPKILIPHFSSNVWKESNKHIFKFLPKFSKLKLTR